MARSFWFAAGAAAGVYAYRRGQQVAEEARGRTVAGNLKAATGSAVAAGRRAKRAAEVTARIVQESRGERVPGELVAEIPVEPPAPSITTATIRLDGQSVVSAPASRKA